MKAMKAIMGSKSKKQSPSAYDDHSDNVTCGSGTSNKSSRSTSSRGAGNGPSKDEIDFFLNADKKQLLERLEEIALEHEAEEKARKKASKGKGKKTQQPLEKRRNESNASALQRALMEGHV